MGKSGDIGHRKHAAGRSNTTTARDRREHPARTADLRDEFREIRRSTRTRAAVNYAEDEDDGFGEGEDEDGDQEEPAGQDEGPPDDALQAMNLDPTVNNPSATQNTMGPPPPPARVPFATSPPRAPPLPSKSMPPFVIDSRRLPVLLSVHLGHINGACTTKELLFELDQIPTVARLRSRLFYFFKHQFDKLGMPNYLEGKGKDFRFAHIHCVTPGESGKNEGAWTHTTAKGYEIWVNAVKVAQYNSTQFARVQVVGYYEMIWPVKAYTRGLEDKVDEQGNRWITTQLREFEGKTWKSGLPEALRLVQLGNDPGEHFDVRWWASHVPDDEFKEWLAKGKKLHNIRKVLK